MMRATIAEPSIIPDTCKKQSLDVMYVGRTNSQKLMRSISINMEEIKINIKGVQVDLGGVILSLLVIWDKRDWISTVED